jgi:hypothetical protein
MLANDLSEEGSFCHFLLGTYLQYVRFQVLTVTSMKMAVFLDVVSCSMVDTDP